MSPSIRRHEPTATRRRGGEAQSESGPRGFQRKGGRKRGDGKIDRGDRAVCPRRIKGRRALMQPDQVGAGVAAVIAGLTGLLGIGMRPVCRRQAVPRLIHPWPGKGRGGPVAEDRQGQQGGEDTSEHVGDLRQIPGVDWLRTGAILRPSQGHCNLRAREPSPANRPAPLSPPTWPCEAAPAPAAGSRCWPCASASSHGSASASGDSSSPCRRRGRCGHCRAPHGHGLQRCGWDGARGDRPLEHQGDRLAKPVLHCHRHQLVVIKA